MSPEQAEGREVTAATDLWSLGVVLFEMLTGTLPFRAPDQRQTVVAILARQPAPPSGARLGVPAEIDRLVLGLLSKDPAGRPASAAEVWERLEALLPGAGTVR